MSVLFFVLGMVLGLIFLGILAAICYYHKDPSEDVLPMTERNQGARTMSKLDMLLERWRSASAERNRLNQEVLWLEEEIRKEREQ